MIKILVIQDESEPSGIWFFPGNEEDLVYDWERFRFPFMSPCPDFPDKVQGNFVFESEIPGFYQNLDDYDIVYSVGPSIGYSLSIGDEDFFFSDEKVYKAYLKMYPEIWKKFLFNHFNSRH